MNTVEKIINYQSFEALPVQPVGKVVMGEEINNLPETKLWQVASKVSKELKKHPNTMLQYTPDMLIKAMHQGRAILCLDENEKLLGFGQIWFYGQDTSKKSIYEFGSWLSFKKGAGKQVISASQLLAAQLFPHARIIAISESSNIRAQNLIESVGGVKFGYKYSEYIKTLDNVPAYMFIYDITLPKLGPNPADLGGKNG